MRKRAQKGDVPTYVVPTYVSMERQPDGSFIYTATAADAGPEWLCGAVSMLIQHAALDIQTATLMIGDKAAVSGPMFALADREIHFSSAFPLQCGTTIVFRGGDAARVVIRINRLWKT